MGLSLTIVYDEDEMDEDGLLDMDMYGLGEMRLCATYLHELDAFARVSMVKTLSDLGAGDRTAGDVDSEEEDTLAGAFFPPTLGQKTLRTLLEGVQSKKIEVGDDDRKVLVEELQELLTSINDAVEGKWPFRFALV